MAPCCRPQGTRRVAPHLPVTRHREVPLSKARRRWSLTRYFVAVSVVGMLALGAALILTMSNIMQGQALRNGTATAQTVGRYAAASIPPEVFGLGVIDPAQHDAVTASVERFAGHLVGLRLWTRDGDVLHDSQNATTGFPNGDRLDAAVLQGTSDARLVTEVEGAAEVMLDYTPTAASHCSTR